MLSRHQTRAALREEDEMAKMIAEIARECTIRDAAIREEQRKLRDPS